MWIGHRKAIRKMTFRELVLPQNESLRRTVNARNVSFRIPLRWPIHIVNPFDKTKVSHMKTVFLLGQSSSFDFQKVDLKNTSLNFLRLSFIELRAGSIMNETFI